MRVGTTRDKQTTVPLKVRASVRLDNACNLFGPALIVIEPSVNVVVVGENERHAVVQPLKLLARFNRDDRKRVQFLTVWRVLELDTVP